MIRLLFANEPTTFVLSHAIRTLLPWLPAKVRLVNFRSRRARGRSTEALDILNNWRDTGRMFLKKQAGTIPPERELMLNLSKVVGQLKKEGEQTQAKLVQLDTALKVLGNFRTTGLGANGRRARFASRRPMSSAAKKRIAAAQRARWAKWRAAQKKK